MDLYHWVNCDDGLSKDLTSQITFSSLVILQPSCREIFRGQVLIDPVADLPLDLVAHLAEFRQLL